MTIKTYAIATAFFLILAIVFQILSVGMDFTGDLYANHFDEAARQAILTSGDVAPSAGQAGAPGYLLVAAEGDANAQSVRWMLDALKLPYTVVSRIDSEETLSGARGVLFAGDGLWAAGDLAALSGYVQGGGQVIFTQLPSAQTAEEEAFLAGIGILSTADMVTYEQCEFYEGLLLGGMVRYAELPITTRHITISNLCKPWAMMWEGDPDAREDEVPLIFERRAGQGVYCVVNGPFLSEADGVGILQALLAIGQEALITPAINAATLSLINFPTLDGDEAALMNAYARGARKATRDVLWNELSYTLMRSDLPVTAFIPAANIVFGAEEAQLYAYLIRSLAELHGELGLMDGMNYADSLKDTFPQYGIYAAYGDTPMPGTHTLARPLTLTDADFMPPADGVVRYPVFTEGFDDSDAINLKVRGFASGMLVIHHAVDMSRPIRLETADDAWQTLNRMLSRFLYSALQPYESIARLNLSDASGRMLAYQMSGPVITPDETGVSIDTGVDAASFLVLRTQHTPGHTQGLSVTRLEDNIYRIKMNGQTGRIDWEEEMTP